VQRDRPTHAALARSGAAACLVGVDLSPTAVRLAARRYRGARFVVNDVHRRLCIADARADLLLNVFAPRNSAEFARVVGPGGLLVTVVPNEAHLRELRAAFPLLGIGADKRARLERQFGDTFRLEREESVTYRMRLAGESLADLMRMTPSYWHLDAAALARAAATPACHVTASFVALCFRRRGRRGGSAHHIREDRRR
jgi:23S rRNA (guanine745-N1)-methyltransferase